MTDIFQERRERVSARDAARRYGLTFDRRGWALCPFHPDKHPSLSFRENRFRCWSCGAAGDSVDFTGRLLGLDPLAAAERINADFGLALPLRRRATLAEEQAARRRMEIAEAHKKFEAWRDSFASRLCEACREGHTALIGFTSWDRLTAREALAVRLHEMFEYWADTLEDRSPENQAQVYRERGRISQWIERVLPN